MKATEDDLLDIIAKEALVDRALLKREATLADLGIASLDVITLLFELEDHYSVVIEEGDMPLVSTLGEMVDYLLGRINAPEPA